MMSRCFLQRDEATGRFLANGQSAKRGLNRSIADASWSELISKIEYMAAKSGKVVFRVNPRHSSQECFHCHHVDPSNRDGEIFLCTRCGHIDDANLQAARTIKFRAIEQNNLVIKVIKKVRRDSPEPKQLSLFETPTPQLIGAKRKHPGALKKSKRREPGNLGEQLDLFNLR